MSEESCKKKSAGYGVLSVCPEATAGRLTQDPGLMGTGPPGQPLHVGCFRNNKPGGNDDEDAVTVTQPAPSSSCVTLHVVSLSCTLGVSSEPARFVRNEFHSFPPSVPGPRTRLDPGGLKDRHGEGEAFFSITFWSPNLPFQESDLLYGNQLMNKKRRSSGSTLSQ